MLFGLLFALTLDSVCISVPSFKCHSSLIASLTIAIIYSLTYYRLTYESFQKHARDLLHDDLMARIAANMQKQIWFREISNYNLDLTGYR